MYKGEREIAEMLKTGKKTVSELAKATGLNEDTIRRAAESLKQKGFLKATIEEKENIVQTEELKKYLEKGEMPEFSLFKRAMSSAHISELSEEEKAIGLRWAKVKGMVDITSGTLVTTIQPEQAAQENMKTINGIKAGRMDGSTETELVKRNLIKKQKLKTVYVMLTGKDLSELKEDEFNINIASRNANIGKMHPLSKVIHRIRHIFAELGFEEMDGSIIETSFWNFDALFQPQDHPARDLADTFYLQGEGELPEDKKLVDRVKKSHEHGWKYKWSENEAKKLVLRTHTTALSARYLANLKQTPKKYFAVGRVFRNESTDFKHLAEFHQVEGIIAWENATFTDLLGILKEFYAKLGFEKIRFRPSYFPYTEPSVEVEVYYEPKSQWMELGGSGIFRPEVSQPLFGKYPVLAWGLSLERPIMMLMGMTDIRTFYKNDLDWLMEARL
jgi:phenylalanyl-tRNA synthetase alpha chain